MMIQAWASTKGYNKGVRLEKHRFRDGTEFYSFIDRFGRPHDVFKCEVEKLIRDWKLEDITEQMRAEGWIQ